jgi:hypothetical protein
MTPPVAAAWSSELERLALRAIVEEYEQLSYTLFGDKLQRPAFELSDSVSRLGVWQSSPPTIILSRAMLLGQPWSVVVEVLKHEMAHQFVSEVLNVTEPSAHGPLFREICRQRGVDGAATGLTAPASVADSSLFTKVTRLLALAQSGERFEAEAAAAAAQRLMLKYNIAEVGRAEERDYCFAHLGKPSGKVEESQRSLASILREFFFVETLWVGVYRVTEGRRGSVLEVCGTRANVEMADYVHSFLNRSAEFSWRQHKVAHGLRLNRDRRKFVAGVMAGFYAKLDSQRARTTEQGLVWMGDAQLNSYFRCRYPKVRTVRYATTGGSNAHAAGRQVGESLVLHRGLGSGPDPSGAAPKRLKGG